MLAPVAAARPAARPARRRSTLPSPTTRRRRGTLLDRPEGLITLANFYRERGRLAEAEARLADSIRLHPGFVPAYANLADLMRQQGRDAEGERVLQQGLAVAPAQRRAAPCPGASADPPAAATTRPSRRWPRPRRSPPTTPATPMSTPWPCRRPASRARRWPCWSRPSRRHPADPDLLFTLAAALLQRGDLAGAKRYAQALGASGATPSQRSGTAADRGEHWRMISSVVCGALKSKGDFV